MSSTNMRLNDFLTMELDGRGILRANWDVLLEEFFKDPRKYICDAGVLKEMQASDRYKRMERAVRDEMDMEEYVNRLYEKGVDTLLTWSEAAPEVKASARDNNKNSLDAAFMELMSSTTTSAPIYLQGYYESVYNASWSHVVEVSDGEGTGMEAKEGKPEQSWTYKAVDDTFERDDAVRKSGEVPPRLMVLTSDKGWPYSWNRKGVESTRDCYVNCEVEQVWLFVKDDLTELLSIHRWTYIKPGRHVLIGTPGIGNSMNAGSYLLYQLLHYDAEQLPMVAYVIGSQSFLFDKITKTVSVYMGDPRIEDVVKIFSRRGVKGVYYLRCDIGMSSTACRFALQGMGHDCGDTTRQKRI
ncbi:retrotransposon hot spot (RHS) protein [Trypanosoma cruzi]|nr:retrotransposon hot spot (RHS) protein [Trypanosoma cruzi]